MSNITKTQIYSDKDLLDYLVFGELSPDEFMNNEKIVIELTDTIANIQKLKSGYCLLTIDIKKNHNIILVVINDFNVSYSRAKYHVYRMTKKSSIENPVDFKLEEIDETKNMCEIIKELSSLDVVRWLLKEELLIELMITNTLDGYKVNTSIVNSKLDVISRYHANNNTTRFDQLPKDMIADKAKSIITNYGMYVNEIKDSAKSKVDKLLNRIDNKDIKGTVKYGNLDRLTTYQRNFNNPETSCYVLHIDDVISVGNRRLALITEYILESNGNLSCRRHSVSQTPGGGRIDVTNSDGVYHYSSLRRNISSMISELPYNYLDKGRMILAAGNRYKIIHGIISMDPKVDTNFIDKLDAGVKSYIKIHINNGINIDDITITDDKQLNICSRRYENTTIQEAMKQLKSMSDEYLFIGKRQKAKGEDVKITDDIIYNHSQGKLTYNNFSIAMDDERVKSSLYERAKKYIGFCYRGEMSEQQAIDNLTDVYFNEIHRIIQYSNYEHTINLILNSNVNVEIKTNVTKNRFTYLNGRRTNKNEIITILKEITCYTSDETASTFIDSITKLGLSVYMGITGGYLYNKRIYKFKKCKGRSNYKLMIGDVELLIKGKKLISKLYNVVHLGEVRYNKDIQKELDTIIFDSIENPIDYVKYRFLINSSYNEFIKKSKTFLDKKVDEVDGKHVSYYDLNRKKKLSGIKVTGTSKNDYIIAYDSKESFVFMNPKVRETNDDVDTYQEGKYICMIDQSNIKTNIGYDTVISKMLSLKNDNMIASQIYNLDDELKKS